MLYFVHGLGFGVREWDRIVTFFSERDFECRPVNLRDGLDLRHAHFQDYVNNLKTLVTEHDIVIGHSMGGLIVQKVAEETNIKAGVGICPAPPKGINFQSHIAIRDVLPALKYLPHIILRKPFKPDYTLVSSLCYKYMAVGLEENAVQEIYNQMVEESPIVMRELAMRQISIDENKISCSLLFIAMKNDRAITPDTVKLIAEKYPTADYKCYDGCHHFFNNKNWQEIAEGIHNFIKTV